MGRRVRGQKVPHQPDVLLLSIGTVGVMQGPSCLNKADFAAVFQSSLSLSFGQLSILMQAALCSFVIEFKIIQCSN